MVDQTMVLSAGTASAADDLATASQPTSVSTPQPETSQVSVPGRANPTSKRGPSVRLRYGAAGFYALLAVVAFVSTAASPGEQPTNLILVITASLGVIALAWELVGLVTGRLPRTTPFVFLPILGTAAVSAGALIAVVTGVTTGDGTAPVPLLAAALPFLAAAPGLAAATMLLSNALAVYGARLVRTDSEFLFPRSFARREDVRLGGLLSYKVGDVVAADGRVERGCIALDERRWSPVSEFRIREEGEVVYAGSQVLAGDAEVATLAVPHESCLSQLQAVVSPLIEDAQRGLEAEDIRASRWSALVILFLSVAAGIFWHERSPGYVQALLAAGTVALFGGVCVVSGLLYGFRRAMVQRWAERGFILAKADSCKQLAAVTSVECDPSRCGEGSLLQGEALEVLDDRLSQTALCDFISALLGRAEDPVLVAAAEYCRQLSHTPSVERVVDLREYPGRGVCGTVHGVELSIGSEDFLVERGIMIQPSEGGNSQVGEQLVLVAIDDDVVARIHVSTDQGAIVPAEGVVEWAGGVSVAVSSGVARNLGDETLLLRGDESDLIGQVATRDVSLFDIADGTLRRSTVIAFTPEIAPLERLLTECRAHIRSVDRYRLLVGFGGLMVLVAAFAGAITPLVPLIVLGFVGAVVRLSHRGI